MRKGNYAAERMTDVQLDRSITRQLLIVESLTVERRPFPERLRAIVLLRDLWRERTMRGTQLHL